MGLYLAVESSKPDIALVAKAKSYTMYQRDAGIWYVNFRADGQQFRVSTGQKSYELARGIVESFRGVTTEKDRFISAKHLQRMIERARYRNRNKGIPFALSTELLRKVAERCGGYCEVTGHALEDEGPFRPSLDRIEPALGYVEGNIRIVCLITNTAMLHYGEAAFLELAVTACKNRGLC